jgi:hypothetical protein
MKEASCLAKKILSECHGKASVTSYVEKTRLRKHAVLGEASELEV